jgi:hypothetical protein
MAAKKSTTTRVQKSIEALRHTANLQEGYAEQLEQSSYAPDVNTRQRIARSFIKWYFVLLLIILVGIPIYNLIAFSVTNGDEYRLDLLDTIQGYSSIVGPLVGFVIGYYFKSTKDQ